MYDKNPCEDNETLLNNPFAALEDKADPRVPSATLQIYDWIGKNLFEEDQGTANRASAATLCVKRRWYANQGLEGLPITPRKRINFLLGDLGELALKYFVLQANVGPGKLYSEVDFGDRIGTFKTGSKEIVLYSQKTLSFQVGGLTITGHADGFGKRNSDGCWELVECKTAANFGFSDFKESGPGDYLKQAHALMMTDYARMLDVKSVRFFFMRKETGHLWDRIFPFNSETAEIVRHEFIAANAPECPSDTPYPLVDEMTGRGKTRAVTGRKLAQWQCQYCPYLKSCHGEYQIEWSEDAHGNMKPKHVFLPEVSNGTSAGDAFFLEGMTP